MIDNGAYLQARRIVSEKNIDLTTRSLPSTEEAGAILLRTVTGLHPIGEGGRISRYALTQAKRFATNNNDDLLTLYAQELLDEMGDVTRGAIVEALEKYDNLPEGAPEPFIIERSGRTGLTYGSKAETIAKSDETITWAISTDEIDRGNERMDISGAILKNYIKNPILLWMHDQTHPTIGQGLNPRRGKTKDGRNALLLDLNFNRLTQLSQDIAALVENDQLKAGSIGFIPIQFEDEPSKPYVDRGEAYPYFPMVRTQKVWELLEFSIVNIPMNAGAVRQKAFDVDEAFEKMLRKNVELGVIPGTGGLVELASKGAPITIIGKAKPTKSDEEFTPDITTDTGIEATRNPTAKKTETDTTITNKESHPMSNQVGQGDGPSVENVKEEQVNLTLNGQSIGLKELAALIADAMQEKAGAALSKETMARHKCIQTKMSEGMDHCTKAMEKLKSVVFRRSVGNNAIDPSLLESKSAEEVAAITAEFKAGAKLSKDTKEKYNAMVDYAVRGACKTLTACVKAQRLMDNDPDNDDDDVMPEDIKSVVFRRSVGNNAIDPSLVSSKSADTPTTTDPATMEPTSLSDTILSDIKTIQKDIAQFEEDNKTILVTLKRLESTLSQIEIVTDADNAQAIPSESKSADKPAADSEATDKDVENPPANPVEGEPATDTPPTESKTVTVMSKAEIDALRDELLCKMRE